MIGSLAAKQYHPGRSDIDTVIVARDSISDEFRAMLKEMRVSYQSKYGIPKGFGGIILREQDMKPPYDPEKELVPEIYRLLQQGKPLWGEYDLSGIPTPSRDDFRAYAEVFYTWLRSLDGPDRERTIVATVNRILIEIRLFHLGSHGFLHSEQTRTNPYISGDRTRRPLSKCPSRRS